MPKLTQTNSIWETLIAFTQAHPLDLQALGQFYDINKLELEKFSALQIRAKRIEFEQRYLKDVQQVAKTWMENQYRLFIWFLLSYSKMLNKQPQKFNIDDWNIIANAFKKQHSICQYFYYCSKKLKTQTWLPYEDKLITDMMKSDMNKRWTDIGLELFRLTNGKSFRKPKSIRERWLSHLNPEIKKVDWTLEQELQLLEKIKEFGKKWSKIAKMFGNRSEHTVKNRYNKLIQKYLRKDEQLTEQEIFQILQNDYRKKLNADSTKKQMVKKQAMACQQTILSNQFIKQQPDPLTEFHFRPTQIFNPIIIIFGGLRV